MAEQCRERTAELQELQALNQTEMIKLNDYYTKDIVPPLFIEQMNVDEYYRKCDLFSKTLEHFIQNNFKIGVSKWTVERTHSVLSSN